VQGALISSQDNRLFLETYLIDTTVTKKGKKVNDQSIDSNVLASRGHPLTLYPKQRENTWIWDHPVIETNSLSDNIELQKKYTIGHEIRMKKVKDGYWNAVYEIIDEGAKKLFKEYDGKTIPFYTSTGIIHSSVEDPLDIKNWKIIHNAIVSEPANGFEKAQAVDMCSGTELACQSILTASANTQIPFCVTAALGNYISSLASFTGSSLHYTMSSETTAQVSQGQTDVKSAINYNPGFTNTNAQTGTGSIPASLTPSMPDTSNVKQDAKTEQKEEVDYKALADQLKSELKQLKTEKEQKDNDNKTITERLASLERENSRNARKKPVFALLQQFPEAFPDVKTGHVNQQEYSKTVLEWIDKGYDDKTIQELLEAKVIKVKNVLQSKSNEQQLKQVYSSVTTPDVSYQSTQMTTASVSSDSSLPIWEQVFDLTNARIKNAAERYQKSGGSY